jgi:hypothetical protein
MKLNLKKECGNYSCGFCWRIGGEIVGKTRNRKTAII